MTDPEKRKEYDTYGKDYVENKERGGNGGGGGGPHFQQAGWDVFKQFFGGGGHGGGHGGQFRFEFNQDDGGGQDFFQGFGGGGGNGGFGGFGQSDFGGGGGGELFTNPGSTVTRLSYDEFKSDVLHSNRAWLIMYYSPNCGHCHQFAPELEKLGGKMKNIVRVGAINCEKEHRACRHIDSYPEIHLFNGDEDNDDDGRSATDSIEYDGPRNAVKLGKWILRNLPSNVNHIKRFSEYQKEFVTGSQFLQLPTCILFSNKEAVPPLFSALSRDYAKHFDFVFVSTTSGAESKKIMDALGVKDSEVPVLLIQNFVVQGARNEKLSGKADLSFEKMSQFLEAYALAMKQVKKYGIKRAAHEDDEAHVVDSKSWDKLCPERGDWLCAIALDAGSSEESGMKKVAKQFVRDKVRFMYTKEGEGDVDWNRRAKDAVAPEKRGPLIFVLNRKKHRAALMESDPTEVNLKTFIETVTSGSGRFKPVSDF